MSLLIENQQISVTETGILASKAGYTLEQFPYLNTWDIARIAYIQMQIDAALHIEEDGHTIMLTPSEQFLDAVEYAANNTLRDIEEQESNPQRRIQMLRATICYFDDGDNPGDTERRKQEANERLATFDEWHAQVTGAKRKTDRTSGPGAVQIIHKVRVIPEDGSLVPSNQTTPPESVTFDFEEDTAPPAQVDPLASDVALPHVDLGTDDTAQGMPIVVAPECEIRDISEATYSNDPTPTPVTERIPAVRVSPQMPVKPQFSRNGSSQLERHITFPYSSQMLGPGEIIRSIKRAIRATKSP